MASSHSTSQTQGLADKVSTFVSENKRAVLIGAAAVVAVGGVAVYYAATTSRGGRGAGGDDAERADASSEEKAGTKRKKPSKKKRTAGKRVDDEDGPILEELSAKVVEEVDLVSGPEPSDADISNMTFEERGKAAATLKAEGNKAYGQRKFEHAANLYGRAIKLTPKPEPVFFSNRAACYMNLSPPKHDLVVADCDEALKLDMQYVKALNRRAGALESLQRYEEALRDYTAATILEKFQNEGASQAVERVLKKLSTIRAAEIMTTRERRLPSHTFVSAYFAAFRARPPLDYPETMSPGDESLKLAIEKLGQSEYTEASNLTHRAVDEGISFDAGKAEALNLRGTFKFLMGEVEPAKDDLMASITVNPNFTQSWVKVASVHMEQGNPDQTFECFDKAIASNPDDPDIYYHRGQVYFIMNDYKNAQENYTKSTELDDEFVFSHIQLAVAQYKAENLATSMATFRRTMKAFPQRSEPQNYYGELLLDQQRFSDAVEKFEKAIELEQSRPHPPPINVLPHVNKGLALYQWKQDIEGAESCCREALRTDPECEAAVATLAQLSLQQGKVDTAVEMFQRQTELARSEPELVNALTYQFASYAQLEFMKNYPAMANQLNQIARTLA